MLKARCQRPIGLIKLSGETMDKKKKEDSINIEGGGNTIDDKYVKGSSIGGRISATKQLGEDSSITGGISGYRSKVKVDYEDGEKEFKNKKITGLDLAYKKGDTKYGIRVDRPGKENKLTLSYNKSFAKGGMVVANCGASVPPSQKAKK